MTPKEEKAYARGSNAFAARIIVQASGLRDEVRRLREKLDAARVREDELNRFVEAAKADRAKLETALAEARLRPATCAECPGMLDRLNDANEHAVEALRDVEELKRQLADAQRKIANQRAQLRRINRDQRVVDEAHQRQYTLWIEKWRALSKRAESSERALTELLATIDGCAWCEEPATHGYDSVAGVAVFACDACAEPGHVELKIAGAVRAARTAIGADNGMAVARNRQQP